MPCTPHRGQQRVLHRCSTARPVRGCSWWWWGGMAYVAERWCGRRLRVLDATALGDPAVLGEAKLDLRTLNLEPNAPPINIWLPLKVRACRTPPPSSETHFKLCSPRVACLATPGRRLSAALGCHRV